MMNKNDKNFWKERQGFMKTYGWYDDNIVDGIPGTETVKSIKQFQSKAQGKGHYDKTNLIDGDWGSETEKAYGKWLKNEEFDVTNSVDSVSAAMMKDMIKRYDAYVKSIGQPIKVYLSLVNSFRRYVNVAKFKDMRKRYENWVKTNKKEPDFVWINVATKLTPTTSGSSGNYATPYLAKFADAVGRTIKTWEDVCIGVKNRKYLYYYNDVHAQEAALKRLKNKLGLNCTDITQLGVQAFKDLGYEVRYRHIMCKQGGHIQCEIRGKELGSTWKKIDLSNSLSNGGSCQTLWCATTSYLIGYDPSWAKVDNGVT